MYAPMTAKNPRLSVRGIKSRACAMTTRAAGYRVNPLSFTVPTSTPPRVHPTKSAIAQRPNGRAGANGCRKPHASSGQQ